MRIAIYELTALQEEELIRRIRRGVQEEATAQVIDMKEHLKYVRSVHADVMDALTDWYADVDSAAVMKGITYAMWPAPLPPIIPQLTSLIYRLACTAANL